MPYWMKILDKHLVVTPVPAKYWELYQKLKALK